MHVQHPCMSGQLVIASQADSLTRVPEHLERLGTRVKTDGAKPDGRKGPAMNPDTAMTIIVSLGVASATVLLVLAVFQGRRKAPHRAAWVAGLVLAGIPAALLGLVALAAAFSDGGSWLIIGVTGLMLLFALAIVRPRWSGWAFIGSGLALPVLLWVGDLLLPVQAQLPVDALRGLMFYTVRASLTGIVLIWSSSATRRVMPTHS